LAFFIAGDFSLKKLKKMPKRVSKNRVYKKRFLLFVGAGQRAMIKRTRNPAYEKVLSKAVLI
jgi:hypothetical protein